MIGRVGRLGIAVTFVSAAASGCATPVEGDPQEIQVPEVTEVTAYPCDWLPAEAIRVAKLDVRPPSRQDNKNPTSLACFFQSHEPRFGVAISARHETLQDLESDDQFTILDEIEIGGRRTYVVDWTRGRACEVAVEITPGILDFRIGYGSNEEFTTPEAACKQALAVVNVLEPYFPEHL